MSIPILKQGRYLIATAQAALTDGDLHKLREDLTTRVGTVRASGVIIDVSAVDLIDSFASRMLRDIAHGIQLRGADTVIVGIQPEVAFAMVQLGLTLDGVATDLDLEAGLARLDGRARDRR